MGRMLLKPPSCGVFFGNLHSKVTDRHLLELGTQAGPVHRASKAKDSAFGFVEYADVESAIYCVGLYHGLLRLFGQSVIVNFSNSPVGQLKPQEQALLDRCIRAIDTTAAGGSNAADSQYAGAGAVRRGGRDTQRYSPYGDARGHREQRAATRAPSRFNDDDDSYHDYGAYGSSDRYSQWPGLAPAAAAAAAQPPPAHPTQPLDAGAVAAMQAAAAAAAAAAAGGLGQPSLAPVQQQLAGGWQVAPPAPVPAQHVNAQAVHVVIQQQPPPQQPPPQQPPPQQQVYPIVQQAPPPVYTQPQQHYQQYQVVDPAAAAYQQWHQQHQQQHPPQQYPPQQYPPQHVQYGAPAAGGGFQTSMPPGLPGQQQQQQPWYQ